MWSQARALEARFPYMIPRVFERLIRPLRCPPAWRGTVAWDGTRPTDMVSLAFAKTVVSPSEHAI